MQSFFILYILTRQPPLNFGSLSLFPALESIYALFWHQQTSFWLLYDMYLCIYQLYHLLYELSDLWILKLLINLSQQQIFLYYVLHTFLHHCLVIMITLIYCKLYYLYVPIFYLVYIFWNWSGTSRLICLFLKSISDWEDFYCSKEQTIHIAKTSITHNNDQVPLLNLLINYMFLESLSQILYFSNNWLV